MKPTAIFAVFALATLPVSAQIQQMKQAPPAVTAKPPVAGTLPTGGTTTAIPPLDALEKDVNARLSTTGGTDPVYLKGLARGLYINGFGAVFTAELDLVNTIDLGPFRPSISAEEKVQVHKRKVAHVPMLQNSMRDVILALAASPTLKNMSDTDQIVVAVKLLYRPWEDPAGLPGQIIMRADRRGGNIKTEVQ